MTTAVAALPGNTHNLAGAILLNAWPHSSAIVDFNRDQTMLDGNSV
jgi:hypothetical protein